ncbi:TetR/AcrR family transcriptional regulator [Paracoccus zeaxanthinifaciens]|uniref:TetR/AcrR family transcriptional regulator n=1 Tax=Paracoccus zeaxanthinifaciens TaxID=187400 RepID=UPI0003B3133A|nr:TetR/AcrR family transcriptional regulator [Paracoccus zeaxanthinifaciens]
MRLQDRICRTRGRPPSPEAAERIVKAATELFLTKGYSATSMQDVARQFGGSKQTIYARFPDRRALVEAVVTAFAERMLQSPRQVTGTGGDPETRLLALADAILRSALEGEAVMMLRLVISECEQMPELAEIAERRARIPGQMLVADVMEQLIREGRVSGDADTLARQFTDLALVPHIWDRLTLARPARSMEQIGPELEAATRFFLKAARPE